MELLFTKGIKGKVKNGIIILNSISGDYITEFSYTGYDLKLLEEKFSIKLIGCRDHLDAEYNFSVVENGQLFDVTGWLYELDAKFVSLYDLIENILFKDEGNYETMIYSSPILLSTEGIEADLFMTKEQFQEALVKSSLMEYLSKEQVSKIIYMRDISSLISSIQEFVLIAYKTLLEASNKINALLSKIIGEKHNALLSDGNGCYEYKYSGAESRHISSLYMSTIIQICSSLDLIAKLTCEIDGFPKDFSKNIRFTSGDIYFNNIRRYENSYKDYTGYENCFINNKDHYTDLILGRNMIIHNSFFSANGWLFYGYKTHVVNNNPLNYMLAYIWDVDEEGKPSHWLNRFRFYGQEREVGEYITKYLIDFYKHMSSTLDVLKQHLQTKSN